MKSSETDKFYNVGTGIRTSLKEIAELLLEITGCSKSINYKARSQATLVKNRIGCPLKASKEIGYKHKVNLRDGLEKLITWRNNHKNQVLRSRQKAL